MRFISYRRTAFVETTRKRAAAERRQHRERDALPLFSELIEEEQPSIDTVMKNRAVQWTETEQARRDFLAQLWRKNRKRLAVVPEKERRELLAHWNNHRWFSATAVHFSGFMDLYEKGSLNFQRFKSGIA